jgi:hypothetical protein
MISITTSLSFTLKTEIYTSNVCLKSLLITVRKILGDFGLNIEQEDKAIAKTNKSTISP